MEDYKRVACKYGFLQFSTTFPNINNFDVAGSFLSIAKLSSAVAN